MLLISLRRNGSNINLNKGLIQLVAFLFFVAAMMDVKKLQFYDIT